MAKILEVKRVRKNDSQIVSVKDALSERREKAEIFLCPECDGKITLVKESVNNMAAHGEHGRGQTEVACSLKDKRVKRGRQRSKAQ